MTKTFAPYKAMIAAGLAAIIAGPAAAQSVEEFYSGKTMEMIIGYAPGGGNDAYARAVARHLGEHLPGNPTIIPKNMPGGGSLVAANYIANVAEKDGTVLGLIASTVPLDEILGDDNIKFKATDLNWIGRVALSTNVTFARSDAPVKTFADALEKPLILAATGAGSVLTIYPLVLNNMFGTKFDLVMGYKGSAESMLAMERGEVQGHTTSTAALETAHPDWMKDGSIVFLVQYSIKRNPALPDTPTAVELAETADDKRVMTLAMSGGEVGKSVLTAAGVPEDRVAALRKAFDDMVADPVFQDELAKSRLELSPLSGVELQEMIVDMSNTSPQLLDKVRAIWPK